MLSTREQQRLLQRMHYSVTVDGQPSAQLTRSIKCFQRDFKQEVTGVLSATDEALLTRVASPSTEGVTHA